MLKNLFLYRLSPEWPTSADQLAEALAGDPFAPCAAVQQKSTGWAPPRGDEHGALVEAVDGQWIARFAIETKAVPGDAVRRKVQEAVDTIDNLRAQLAEAQDALQAAQRLFVLAARR